MVASDSRRPVTLAELVATLPLVADLGDLKPVLRPGHSRGVAELAGQAGTTLGRPAAEVVMLRRAALVHDRRQPPATAPVPAHLRRPPHPTRTRPDQRGNHHGAMGDGLPARPPPQPADLSWTAHLRCAAGPAQIGSFRPNDQQRAFVTSAHAEERIVLAIVVVALRQAGPLALGLHGGRWAGDCQRNGRWPNTGIAYWDRLVHSCWCGQCSRCRLYQAIFGKGQRSWPSPNRSWTTRYGLLRPTT